MFHTFTSNATAVRRATIGGRAFIVAPVTMLSEGVFSGSRGPLFYPAEELAESADDWNGKPITLRHPEINGRHVSASRRPDLVVGSVAKVRFDPATSRLRAVALIDEQRVRRLAPATYRRLLSGRTVEVSTGLFAADEVVTGRFAGKRFRAIARDHQPDHLAILPDGVGACSVMDGCGVHNRRGEAMRDSDLLPPSTCPGLSPGIVVNEDDDDFDEDVFDDEGCGCGDVCVCGLLDGDEGNSDDEELDGDDLYLPPSTFNAKLYAERRGR